MATALLLGAPVIAAPSEDHGGRLFIPVSGGGILLPDTLKVVPGNETVDPFFTQIHEENKELIFLRRTNGEDVWYGVVARVVKVFPGESRFLMHFTQLVTAPNPIENMEIHNNRYYIKHATLGQANDINSSSFQAQTRADVEEFISSFESFLQNPPNKHKAVVSKFMSEFSDIIQFIRKEFKDVTSLNQMIHDLVESLKFQVEEESATNFLKACSIQNRVQSLKKKSKIFHEIFASALKNGHFQSQSSLPQNREYESSDLESFRAQLQKLDVADGIRTELSRMIDQYEMVQHNPHEGPLLYNYLRFALNLPWNEETPEDNLQIKEVQHHLDEHQYGMQTAKERVLDYLALRQISPHPMPTILCLVGKPGTGKTSIGKVLADALGKNFVRIALGGVASEAEIRGHRRTYVGAMPGRIMDAIRRAGTRNPVCILDEIDKLSSGAGNRNGDPAAALLEALDPQQNNEFHDHFLDLPFDLSKVIFIATANDLHTIPAALKDRMDIVQVPAYTVDEKITIAQKIILPRLIKRAGFGIEREPHISADVIRATINNYTFEDGLRGLTNKLNILMAKHARSIIDGEEITFTVDNLHLYLGEAHAQLEELKRKAKEVEPFLSAKTRKTLFDNIERYDKLKEDDPGRPRLYDYIHLIVSLPWGKHTEDTTDMAVVSHKLESSHYGLDKVNERVLDYLALRTRNPHARATILCLVGPPGVGKTSVGEAIAQALGKKFERVALGGSHTENHIRGTSRTFVGAEPGAIIKALEQAQSSNSLIMLDEIDKIQSGGSNGDPAAALLEVLDPAQNNAFVDKYINIEFDLSDTLFIATANDISRIPLPLYDRMEMIELEGYNTQQKIQIARRHLIPRLLKQANLEADGPIFTDRLLRAVIRSYTMEAGVRKLNICLNTLVAKYARALALGKDISFDPDNLIPHLGAPIANMDPMPQEDRIGVVNGLYYSLAGGGVNQHEVMVLPGSGKITLTGQMGQSMEEACRMALSLAYTAGVEYGVDPSAEKRNSVDIHLHVPSGAYTKNDGASGGTATTVAFISALTNRPIRHNYAMTGTMSFQGNVGAIGGLDQKIEGARRNGMDYVIVPRANMGDIQAMKKVPTGIEIIYVDTLKEVLDLVLLDPLPELEIDQSRPQAL